MTTVHIGNKLISSQVLTVSGHKEILHHFLTAGIHHQIAKHTLGSVKPEGQPISKGLPMANSKILPEGGSENTIWG